MPVLTGMPGSAGLMDGTRTVLKERTLELLQGNSPTFWYIRTLFDQSLQLSIGRVVTRVWRLWRVGTGRAAAGPTGTARDLPAQDTSHRCQTFVTFEAPSPDTLPRWSGRAAPN